MKWGVRAGSRIIYDITSDKMTLESNLYVPDPKDIFPIQVYLSTHLGVKGFDQVTSLRHKMPNNYLEEGANTPIEILMPELPKVLAVLDLQADNTEIMRAIDHWRDSLKVVSSKDIKGRRKSGRHKGSNIQKHHFETLLRIQSGQSVSTVYDALMEKGVIGKGTSRAALNVQTITLLKTIDPSGFGHKNGKLVDLKKLKIDNPIKSIK